MPPSQHSNGAAPYTSSTSPPSLSPTVPEGANTSFAFLVHSQETIPNNLPPSVDNKPLARQRRRRTSPEDQAILEEEFQRDSKPDKAARCRIVERVALGEKEVQIWFQNRRQNSRRKSRPLLAHEILPFLQASRGAATSSSPTFSDAQPSETTSRHSDHAILPTAECASRLEGNRSSPDSLVSITSQSGSSSLLEDFKHHLSQQETSATFGVASNILVESSNEASLSSPNPEARPPFRRASPSTNRVLAVADLISPEPDVVSTKLELQNQVVEQAAQICQAGGDSVPTLKRPRSTVRLSMTSDGAARLLTGDESSPSPPRSEIVNSAASARPNGLRRSFSAAGINDSFNLGRFAEPSPAIRRVPSGRSRDSRAWEFWCDTEARNELVKKADQEQLGSAADAISLIRSNSRGPLTPNMNKGNVNLMRHSSAKRAKTESISHVKPMLGRAKSSIARLEAVSSHDVNLHDTKESDTTDKSTNKSSGVISPTGDSDKENWEPSTQTFGNARRRLPPIRTIGDLRRPILMESRTIPSPSSGISLPSIFQRGLNGIIEGASEIEDNDPEKDEEIANFMRPRHEHVTPARVAGDDDMDCIQGLLSLSQGAWR